MNFLREGLRNLISPFQLYKKESPNFPLIITTAIVISISIVLEYGLEISKRWDDLGIALDYFFPFITIVFLSCLILKRFWILQSLRFWVFFLLVFAALYASDSMKFHVALIRDFVPGELRFIVYKFTVQLKIWLIYGTPALLCYMFFRFTEPHPSEEKERSARLEIPIVHYLIVLVPMILVVVLASFGTDFKEYYPRVPGDKPEFGYVSTKGLVFGFEIVYALAFFATEWFFRGFLLDALNRFFGKDSILIMTVLYVIIHFEKPILETISSGFGGFALGIYAYYTKKIRGGVLIHIGIALTMELAGWFWKYYS
ncbi:CPBP family intramembrane glutamic endopeptidase [Leptospira idonii]|uniref:CPBP family intramembrane metalloprotease n=1 Tax=Leptospira idonii TaxID=1193500 RepID=A0A4R9LWE9_9LEPT|nr:CPBP family intramembrane glutamic endopeptidase [Leptospira idonii]TGN17149.1 CPBP family intramembrane metalloprotease [Leptospira idonii]